MKVDLFKSFVTAATVAVVSSASAQEPLYLDSIPGGLDDEVLDEVVVTGAKPLVQTQADKVTYNMDADPAAQTATVIDALRKVPMVSVDADGNIKLKGDGNFKIYMNGKPDPSLSSNYKDILRAMPASSVKKVEVITEPGAKYDAEGVGGIINIITESRSVIDGYTATVSLTGSNRNIGAGINALAKMGKVSFNLNYNHAYNMSDGMSQQQSVIYLNDPVRHNYRMRTKMDIHNNFDFGGLQASWEPDSSNLVTVSANLFNVSVPVNTTMHYDMLTKSGESLWSYKSRADMRMRYFNYTVGANWQHNFSTPDHNIVFLYQYSRNSQKDSRTYIYEDYVDYPGTIPSLRNEMTYPDNEHTFQVDYTLPFMRRHTLEAGAKYIMRRNHGDTRQFTSADGENWTLSQENSVDMNQHQDVAAVYAAWTGKFGPWVTKAGLRYEYARLSSEFGTPGHDDFSQDLNDMVPNAMVSYTMPDYSSLSLAYQMRITRPGMEQLNPFRNQESPLSVTYGNPRLISQNSNNVNLTYSNFSLPVQMNITLGYTYTDKLIQKFEFLGEDNVSNTTYGNFGHCNQGSLFAYLAYPIIPGMRLSVNGGVNYTDYKSARVGVDNHGWGWNVGGDFSYQMPWNLELTAYGGAGKNAVDFQSSHSVWSYHGLGVTKSLLSEKRMRISLTATNFATPVQKYTYKTVTSDMITVSTGRFRSWNVGVTVSYRIGSFNSRIRQTAKTISNDDVSKSQSSGPGSVPAGGGTGR